MVSSGDRSNSPRLGATSVPLTLCRKDARQKKPITVPATSRRSAAAHSTERDLHSDHFYGMLDARVRWKGLTL